MKFLNFLKRKYSKTKEMPVNLTDAAVASFRDQIYRYPRIYFLRKGPSEIRVMTRKEGEKRIVSIEAWKQRGIQ